MTAAGSRPEAVIPPRGDGPKAQGGMTSAPSAVRHAPDEGAGRAELMAVLSMATDYAMGQPVEYALASCMLAMRIADEMGVSERHRHDVYYQALLRFIGCNAETHAMSAILGDEIAFRTDIAAVDMGEPRAVLELVLRYMRAARAGADPIEALRGFARGLFELPSVERSILPGHCEVAQRLARRLGFAGPFVEGVGQLYARWDGRGIPAVRGEAITLPVRIVTLAQDLVTFARLSGVQAALSIARERRGRQYDPALVDRVLGRGATLLESLERDASFAAVIALAPDAGRRLSGAELDDACRALADFADIKSPWTLTHSDRVADLAARAAARAGLADATRLRRAGWLHDLGRVAVSAGVWGKPAALSEREWDRVRLHGYYTERILARAPSLGGLATLASSAHERIDGGGYHRGAPGTVLETGARLLAAADAWCAMTESRPYRQALDPGQAAQELRRDAMARRLDPRVVDAVLECQGQAPAKPPAPPAGLSEREAEVIGWLARGLSNKAIARKLGVSHKTVDKHVQHAYEKAGVRTRAGATMFAMEHMIVPP